MSINRVPADTVLHRLSSCDTIIDARSEGEYAHDHLPGAVNWPTLHDDERARVGTLNQQESAFEARKVGAALAARNIAVHLQRELGARTREWRPLVYCWRGGLRSAALATVLDQVGFRVDVLAGGYKAYRKALIADLPAQATRLHYRVLCGPTGSGKTRLLHALAAAGAQVLDLEALACHRASVLGAIPGQPQPTQKRFETLLWGTLRALDATRPVFVESESRKVGDLALPEALVSVIRASPCIRLELPDRERVELLLEDYPFFAENPKLFCDRLEALTALRGIQLVKHWKSLVAAGKLHTVVKELLHQHYDPGYLRSTRRNFPLFKQALCVPLQNRSWVELQRAVTNILSNTLSRP